MSLKKHEKIEIANQPNPYHCLFLLPGVHTSDIITVYISAIKALRELDPSMVILQVACQPIRKYLRLVWWNSREYLQPGSLESSMFLTSSLV